MGTNIEGGFSLSTDRFLRGAATYVDDIDVPGGPQESMLTFSLCHSAHPRQGDRVTAQPRTACCCAAYEIGRLCWLDQAE